MSKRLHVAIVDDEESVRLSLERFLHWAGVGVATFGSGAEFLASTPKPDCVVLDLHMPGVSGFDVQAELASLTPRLPVIVITGNDTPDNRARAKAGGVLGYFCKPVDGPTLLAAIKAAVAKAGHAELEPHGENQAP
jgi:FixJ family two-component response regulator